MPDIFTKRKRSEIMSRVKSKNTSIETLVFKFLTKENIAFKRHYKNATGTPDIAIPSLRLAVFIDSDFWHGWQFPRWKHTLSSDFWKNKIERNRNRDKSVTRRLRRQGWRVLRVWEHQLKARPLKTFSKIKATLITRTRQRHKR